MTPCHQCAAAYRTAIDASHESPLRSEARAGRFDLLLMYRVDRMARSWTCDRRVGNAVRGALTIEWILLACHRGSPDMTRGMSRNAGG